MVVKNWSRHLILVDILGVGKGEMYVYGFNLYIRPSNTFIFLATSLVWILGMFLTKVQPEAMAARRASMTAVLDSVLRKINVG